MNSSIIFENGQDFIIGNGIRIIKLPSRLVNDSDKTIKTIRDSIAHSRYTLVGQDIHIINRDFEALVSIGWLEQMTLCLFSNKAHTSLKSGVSDSLIISNTLDDFYIQDEKDLKKVNFLNNDYDNIIVVFPMVIELSY